MEEFKFIDFTKFFLENPYQEVYLREAAKKAKISPFAAKKYADILVKEAILVEEKRANLRYLKLNMANIAARYLKISLNLKNVVDSGLIEYLKEEVKNISSITLFGSVARGEDDMKSDLDLVLIGKDKTVALEKFEKKIGKSVNLHVFSCKEWNKNFKDNKAFYLDVVAHGIAMYGELPVVEKNGN